MDYGLDYSKAEGLFSKSTGTAGSNLQKYEGSFEKLSTEGVWRDLSHLIGDGRWGLDPAGERGCQPATVLSTAVLHWQR